MLDVLYNCQLHMVMRTMLDSGNLVPDLQISYLLPDLHFVKNLHDIRSKVDENCATHF